MKQRGSKANGHATVELEGVFRTQGVGASVAQDGKDKTERDDGEAGSPMERRWRRTGGRWKNRQVGMKSCRERGGYLLRGGRVA